MILTSVLMIEQQAHPGNKIMQGNLLCDFSYTILTLNVSACAYVENCDFSYQ